MESGANSEAAAAAAAGAEEESLVERAKDLIARISASQAKPNPKHLHALASMLEDHESRYVQESGVSSVNNNRASHTIGKLGSLVRDNDEFYELISSKFLSESRYSVAVRSASARVLLSCSSTSTFPHIFDDTVLDNIKTWVMEDTIKDTGNDCDWKREFGVNKPTDSEMLKTYACGLLAVSLAGGTQVVEDILTSGLSAKLMRYLRTRILGESNANQKDACFLVDNKHATPASSMRSREESRGRSRQVLDSSRLDGLRPGNEGLLGDQSAEKDCERNGSVRQAHEGECWGDGGDKSEIADSAPDGVDMYEMVEENADLAPDGLHKKDLVDGRVKYGERHAAGKSSLDEDAEENLRDDSSRRRVNRLSRTRGKGRNNDNPLENERNLTSPPGLRLGGTNRGSRDRNQLKNDETRKFMDTKKNSGNMDSGDSTIVEDNDERFKECTIGSKDISEVVKEATCAAESEARAANAPAEAIKAAGDAAAELVKSAAFEVLKNTNDEEAAVLAASRAASTVVDAAMATEMSRNSSKINADLVDSKPVEFEIEEKQEEFFILDDEPLSQLREKYCIQCLEILGEYVEALGPVLHEKGVDVCLALLQRSLKGEGATDQLALLPEVLKLICALAAHRKFAAVFVDRGGVQKLLSVRRVLQTFFGLSSCLFTIGSLQGIMERVCALPSDIVHQVVELALQLLECPQDQARKNAAIFFSGAFVFRAILDSFDAQEGLQKMLNLLHGAASVRSGGNSGALGIPNGTLRNDRSPAEVLTASEKQIAYHTCVALRQYFRAHLLLLVDSLRPNKSNRSIARSTSSARAAYKPLDISNEAMDAVLHQIQRDRKLGAAFVRARWPVVDKFLASNGHITMLELCQAPPVERYLHDLAQYALGVLHIVTFVYYSRKKIVSATLSNDRVGMAVILDAANCSGYVDPEVIHPALNVLVNLVCPPPSISNKPTVPSQGQQSSLSLYSNATENKDRQSERNVSDRTAPLPIQNETREHNGDANLVERAAPVTPFSGSNTQATTPAPSSGVVGDRRISLGPGAGCAGLAAQLEQEYHQAREAVRANNGIKVLLHLLHPRMITPPLSLDCLRALACRVLLGLARDETIAHILTKLQVGKKLSELIRDSGTQISGAEQGRWQSELAQVAIELIAVVTNAGRDSTLAATDAAAPTLRRIERAAIAAATPITYHSRELLLLILEHLQTSGLAATAALLQKEADLMPLPPLVAPQPPHHQTFVQETSSVLLQWPSSRIATGFLSDITKSTQRDDDVGTKSEATYTSSRKKPLVFASNLLPAKSQLQLPSSVNNTSSAFKSPAAPNDGSEISSPFCIKSNADMETPSRTPLLLPLKRKLIELKDPCSLPAKRLATAEPVPESPVFQTPNTGRRSFLPVDSTVMNPAAATTTREPFGRATSSSTLVYNSDDLQFQTPGAQLTHSQHGYSADQQTANAERMTLDSLVVQYLKHQHRQCPAPITTLPPLSLLHPHVCPEPSRSLNAPANVTARVSTREFRKQYGGIHAHRRDRQFVYSRFRPCRICRDDTALLTSISFLGDTFHVATGSHAGELKIFDLNNGNVLESHACHQTPISLVQSAFSAGSQMILSSASYDVKLWDGASISGGPLHSFDGCKAARFSQSGTMFAALSTEPSRREVLLYDMQTYNVELRLSESSNGPSGPVRGHGQSLIHFSPIDTMLLWNGILWDRRSSGPIHRFDQFTDYGGGGFHPAGNEVILNSEVWDLRKFKLLRSVPSLDQTVITFNGGGDVIYAILRRNLEDITSAVNTRRSRHPLFPAFRTIDAVNYSDIATVPVGRCVLDFAADPTDSYVGVVAMDDNEEMFSSARLYEVGRRRPTDDDSDPDDGPDTDDDEDDEDNDESEADDVDPILGGNLDGDSDSDMSNDDDEDDVDDLDSGDDLDEDADFNDVDFDGGQGIFGIVAEGEDGDDDDSEVVESYSSEDEGDFR